MTDDNYLSRCDDMLGEKLQAKSVQGNPSTPADMGGHIENSKPSIHPVWKLIDAWGGKLWLEVKQLTLWEVEV